jgi:GxxExxY protein
VQIARTDTSANAECDHSGTARFGTSYANSEKMPLLHEALTKRVIDVFYDVYAELGHGFLEKVYQSAMVIALTEAGLAVAQRVPYEVWFRGRPIGEFVTDIVVNELLLLELKAAAALNSWDEAQTLNYLRASPLELALLMNFGPRAEYRRRIFTNDRKRPDQRTRQVQSSHTLISHGRCIIEPSSPRDP